MSDLDLKNLTQISNIGDQKQWTKYIVFNLVDSTKSTTTYKTGDVTFEEKFQKLNEWKKIYEINSKETTTTNNEQNTLTIVLAFDSNGNERNIKIKFINFLTPSFTLPESDEATEEEGEEDSNNSEDNGDS